MYKILQLLKSTRKAGEIQLKEGGRRRKFCSQDTAFMYQKQNSPTQALYFAGINSELAGLTVLENLLLSEPVCLTVGNIAFWGKFIISLLSQTSEANDCLQDRIEAEVALWIQKTKSVLS